MHACQVPQVLTEVKEVTEHQTVDVGVHATGVLSDAKATCQVIAGSARRFVIGQGARHKPGARSFS